MESLKKQEVINEFWRKANEKQVEENLKKIVIEFDLEKDLIHMSSDAKNVNGDAMMDWNLDTKTGEIIEATREKDGSKEKIIEREVSPESLHNEEVAAALEKIEANKPEAISSVIAKVSTQEETESASNSSEQTTTDAASSAGGGSPMNMTDLDMQRDIAFKIVYFFIVFIVATFGLLYAYFQMNKKELEEEERRMNIKHQSRNKNKGNDHTFFDFLAGSVDEENFTANPYSTNSTRQASDRDETGFGSANLESLNERPVFYHN